MGTADPSAHVTAHALAGALVRRRAWRGHVLVTVLWAAAVAGSTRLELTGIAFEVVLAVHVLGLVIGLGAVLLVDWYGLVWMSGRRTFREVQRLGEAAHTLVWLGLGLLLVSGAGLSPDLGSAAAWAKQVLVLGLLNNGVALRPTSRRLRRVSAPTSLRDLPLRLRSRLLASLVISQVCWWGAVVVGFLTTGAHRLG